MPPPLQRPLICVGGGTMATAIIHGGLEAGVLIPSQVTVVDHDPVKLAGFAALGCLVAPSAKLATASLAIDAVILLAIKPQSLRELAQQVQGRIGSRLVISILAGVPCLRVQSALGGQCRVLRAMPNTAARIRMSVTAICSVNDTLSNVSSDDFAMAKALFASIGSVHELESESQMPLFTLLAASGPAYLFYMAQALEQAAVAQGMSPNAARTIVAEVIEGAITLMSHGPIHDPVALRAAVTSKGGVTAAAIDTLEQHGVLNAFDAALRAGVARDAQLGAD
jgi:pyrroline-5-carboxylate reductase